MRKLTATLCLTFAVLFGTTGCGNPIVSHSGVSGGKLPPCIGDPSYWSDCMGTITWNRGNQYVGEFRDRKFHGQGTYTFANGLKYVGEFRNGNRHGQGELHRPSGTVLKGSMKNNKWNPTVTNRKDPTPSKSAAEKENERLQKEIARLKGKPETPSLTDSSNMQEAKKECSELGFKTGTEKFGECVLQLTE
jgi:hypothetical protein